MLRYALREGKEWRYHVLKKKDTSLEIPKIGMDLSRKSTLQKDYALSFISRDAQGHLKLAVSINDIRLVTQSSSGEDGVDFPDAKGRVFHLIVTDVGKEIKYAGIDDLKGKIKTQSGKTVTMGIENFFYNILLDLPEKRIHIGDVWKTGKNNTIINEDGIEQTVIYNVVCTLEALTKMNDTVCLKIKKYSSGTLTGAGTSANGVLENYSEFRGKFESFGTVYFDPENSVVRKAETTNKIQGEVTIQGFFGRYTEPFETTEKTELSLVP
jgi:hypothetical protein